MIPQIKFGDGSLLIRPNACFLPMEIVSCAGMTRGGIFID
jgi:hypothetical protein